MADKVYDIVYVGAGNKNLINAMYTTKYGGLKVALFETRHEEGSGWCSDESPAPGFVANHCSHIHSVLHPTARCGWIFRNGRNMGCRYVSLRSVRAWCSGKMIRGSDLIPYGKRTVRTRPTTR